MLELRVEGDTHPKTFKLVTDDADGELDRIREILVDEVGVDPDDPIWVWFDATSADQFREGAVVPVDQVGEFVDILENDWPETADVLAAQQREAMEQAQAKAEGGG
jgi:hypothetical protein